MNAFCFCDVIANYSHTVLTLGICKSPKHFCLTTTSCLNQSPFSRNSNPLVSLTGVSDTPSVLVRGKQHSQLSTFPFHLGCLMTSFSIWITISSKQRQPFLSVSKGLCWLLYSASLLQAGAVLTQNHKALVACNSSINKLVGAPAFPIGSGTEIWSLSVNRDQTLTGKWAWPLIPKLYWPSSTWTNMSLRVEQPLLHQPHPWMCKFSSLSKQCLSGVMKGMGLLMANRKQKISSSHRVSHSHICECSDGISAIAWQGHRERLTPISRYSSIYTFL